MPSCRAGGGRVRDIESLHPRSATPPPAPHAVYRCYDTTRTIIYIGATFGINDRLKQHAAATEWWGQVDDVFVTFHPSRRAAFDAERREILKFRPRYNVQLWEPRS